MKVLDFFKNKIIYKSILTLSLGLFFYTTVNHNLSYRIISIDYYSQNEFSKMRDGVGIVNAARGGVIDEMALLNNISKNKVSFAALDTFENEPNPSIKILMNQNISLTPHIGAATNEAQKRIGIELADQIINIYNS